MRSGEYDGAVMREALSQLEINVPGLRVEYARLLEQEAELVTITTKRKKQDDKKDQQKDHQEGSDEQSEPEKEEGEEEGEKRENQIDESSEKEENKCILEDKLRLFESSGTLTDLKVLLLTYLEKDQHSPSDPIFKKLWKAMKKLEQLPMNSENVEQQHNQEKQHAQADNLQIRQRLMEDILNMYLELVEELDDPWLLDRRLNLPYDFMADLRTQAEKIAGQRSEIALKMWLLLIFNSTDEGGQLIDEFLEKVGGLKVLKQLFISGRIPPPSTGTFIDTRLDDDVMRDIRYFFTLGNILQHANDPESATRALKECLKWSMAALSEPASESMLRRIRGNKGAVQNVVMNHVRILMMLTTITLYRREPLDALIYMQQAMDLERIHHEDLEIPDDYTRYLQMVSSNPSFQPNEVRDLMVYHSSGILGRQLIAISLQLQARALGLALRGRQDKAYEFLEVALDCVQDRLNNLANNIRELCFETGLHQSTYQLLLLRMTIRISEVKMSRQDKLLPPRERMIIIMNFLREVKEFSVDEEVTDEDYQKALIDVLQRLSQVSREEDSHELVVNVCQTLIQTFSPIEQEDLFRPYVSYVHEIMAQSHWTEGHTAQFMSHMLLSIFLGNIYGSQRPEGCQEDVGMRPLLEGILQRLAETVDQRIETSSGYQETQLKNVWEVLQGLYLGLRVEDLSRHEQGRHGPRSLLELSKTAFVTHYEAMDVSIQSLFTSDIINEILREFYTAPKEEEEEETKKEEQSDDDDARGCPKRRKRLVGVECVDTAADEDGENNELFDLEDRSVLKSMALDQVGNAHFYNQAAFHNQVARIARDISHSGQLVDKSKLEALTTSYSGLSQEQKDALDPRISHFAETVMTEDKSTSKSMTYN